MKTLIVFLLYSVLTDAVLPPQIEIYEIKETSDDSHQLYINDKNEPIRRPRDDSILSKLLRPYYRNIKPVEKITQDLIHQLKFLRRNKLIKDTSSQNIFVVDPNLLDNQYNTYDYVYNDDADNFVDETRNNNRPLGGKTKNRKQKSSLNKLNQNKLSQLSGLPGLPVLRSGLRTRPPHLRYRYDPDPQ